MTETTMQVLHTINAVDGFNPAEFTRNLSNEDGGIVAVLVCPQNR